MSKQEVKNQNKPQTQQEPIDQERLTKITGKAEELLEQTIVELIFAEPFYANLIMGMRREFTVKLPTLGVNVTDQVNLYINPYFFSAMSLPQRVDVLKHEAHHVINNHFVRFRDIEPKVFENVDKSIFDRIMDMQKASMTNKAADAAINEYLPNLPRKVKMFDQNGNTINVPTEITDDKGNKIPNPDKDAGKPVEADLVFVDLMKKKFPHIENRQTMEYYYEFLKEQQDKNGGDGTEQFMVLDDHNIWHESDNTEDDITQKVKDAVNKAAEQTADKDMGKLPGDVLAAIEKLNHVPKDWRQDIQRFSARCAEILIEATRKKRNRRYGILYPGNKTFPKLQLTIGLDSSGSVGNEELTQFHAEMIRLHNMGIDLTVIECDAQVNSVYKFDPKKEFKIHGRGGTAFKPVFDHIDKEKLETDGLIYFTDGACWGEDIKKPKYPVLWALTAPFNLDASIKFGAKTKVELRKRVRR
jgi:predicted metal-dependent peptidase